MGYLKMAGGAETMLTGTYGVEKTCPKSGCAPNKKRWSLKDVFIATLYDDIEKLRLHFKKTKYSATAPSTEWSKFFTYFASNGVATKWMDLTLPRSDHNLKLLPYISYVLFG